MFFGKDGPGPALVIALLLAARAMPAGADSGDWRLELLIEEKVPTATAGLLEFQDKFKVSTARLEQAVGLLGADGFATRERAEREILLMGREILPELRRLPRSDDPEVRARLTGIGEKLTAGGRWAREDLVRQAVGSLLRERLDQNPGAPAGDVFAEFFQTPVLSLAGGYRKFRFKADPGMTGLVSDGVLRMKGNHAGEGEQRLLLDARDLTGRKEFPSSFRIEVRLGGKAGGEGGYHVGVSVGNVRALFHPGYAGGGFRFERVDEHAPLVPNSPMGFTPSTDDFQRMGIDVKQHADGKVELQVEVAGGDAIFRQRTVVEGGVIGKLDHISLDRSGRAGGDGVFDDFVVDLGIP